jgi:hypothetical protein
MELSQSIMAAKQSAVQQSAAIKIMKKSHEMQMSIINMIDSVARSAPAPDGQGLTVDKTA